MITHDNVKEVDKEEEREKNMGETIKNDFIEYSNKRKIKWDENFILFRVLVLRNKYMYTVSRSYIFFMNM